MKNLLLTTAMVAMASGGAIAQTVAPSDGTQSSVEQGATIPAFLVSDFTGKSLHALDTDATRDLAAQRQTTGEISQESAAIRWESSATFSEERDAWENVGNIDDIVLTADGDIRGVLVDIGGFLGFGARTVMVDLDDLYFVAEAAQSEDMSDFNVVVAMSRDQLEGLPEWDDSQLGTGFTARSYPTGMHEGSAEHAAAEIDAQNLHENTQNARTEVPAGYRVMTESEQTADRLLGANVYGREGEEIATVDDIVIGADDSVTDLIIDVGGFLGMGTHTVAFPAADVDILWNDADNNVRVQVPMTQEEMESLPEYDG